MSEQLRFGLIGAAAYVAPRHMQAIRDTGNVLSVALDPHDSVGILDHYSIECEYFSEPERFQRYLYLQKRLGKPIDWISVCSPNYLHDAHCQMALWNGADVICEKPLCLTPRNLDALSQLEQDTGRRVYTVLQLRLHEAVKQLKASLNGTMHDVDLTYVTSRGPWFARSWKGDEKRSGGHIANIGIHFLDVLLWLFGGVQDVEVHYSDDKRISGHLKLNKARVRWFLSVSRDDVPEDVMGPTYRSMSVDGNEVEFSQGFEKLHTETYAETLAGRGLGIEDARPSVELSDTIRNLETSAVSRWDHAHPMVDRYV